MSSTRAVHSLRRTYHVCKIHSQVRALRHNVKLVLTTCRCIPHTKPNPRPRGVTHFLVVILRDFVVLMTSYMHVFFVLRNVRHEVVRGRLQKAVFLEGQEGLVHGGTSRSWEEMVSNEYSGLPFRYISVGAEGQITALGMP